MTTFRYLRTQKELTLKQVSERIGISTAYLSSIERGASMPSQEVLDKLNGLYGSSVTEDVSYPRCRVSQEYKIVFCGAHV